MFKLAIQTSVVPHPSAQLTATRHNEDWRSQDWKRITCWYFSKIGHLQKECWLRIFQVQSRKPNNHGYQHFRQHNKQLHDEQEWQTNRRKIFWSQFVNTSQDWLLLWDTIVLLQDSRVSKCRSKFGSIAELATTLSETETLFNHTKSLLQQPSTHVLTWG